jgi:hypothetical protein
MFISIYGAMVLLTRNMRSESGRLTKKRNGLRSDEKGRFVQLRPSRLFLHRLKKFFSVLN